jgi:hypothetical protein
VSSPDEVAPKFDKLLARYADGWTPA